MVKSYAKKPAEDWPPLFFRILNNQITDRHRKRGLGRLTQWFGSKQDDDAPEAVDQLESEDFCPETLASSLDLQTAVKSAMDTLSHQQQQALILRLWEGLSVKETATAMSISEGSVKTHLSRAVQAMRTQLEEHRSA
jgi:RNA polymerase sigma-70 factor (ECF subfamily)